MKERRIGTIGRQRREKDRAKTGQRKSRDINGERRKREEGRQKRAKRQKQKMGEGKEEIKDR